ncbi:hypothetical protein ACT453_42060, partial [Bacillus sp. D-CC]
IHQKEEEGIHIFSILFGAPDTKIGATFHHNSSFALLIILHISFKTRSFERICDIINRAKEELWISVWEDQVHEIEPYIHQKEEEGIHIFSILFGAPDTKIGA